MLGQLGNRAQHALRAFTPRDQKAVKSAADTFRSNPDLDVATAITQLSVGEALISFLDEKGTPGIVQQAFVCPPHSQIGPITPDQRQTLMKTSLVAGVYETPLDRQSAYEVLKGRTEVAAAPAAQPSAGTPQQATPTASSSGSGILQGLETMIGGALTGTVGPRGGRTPGIAQAMMTSAARSIGTQVGRQLIRGVLGSLMGGGSTRQR